jgi:biopolymer transport protein ExbD
MARTFRRQRTASPIAELNLTNLIDLGFTLLIIFMIATPLIQQEQTIPVNLPTEGKRGQPKAPSETRFQPIVIDHNGQYYFGQRRVSYKELETLVAGLGVLRTLRSFAFAQTSRCNINK